MEFTPLKSNPIQPSSTGAAEMQLKGLKAQMFSYFEEVFLPQDAMAHQHWETG